MLCAINMQSLQMPRTPMVMPLSAFVNQPSTSANPSSRERYDAEVAKLKAIANSAPDQETQERTEAFENGESPNMSRGQRVTTPKGPTRIERRTAAIQAQSQLLAAANQLSQDDYEELIEGFARRLLRGDLKRKF